MQLFKIPSASKVLINVETKRRESFPRKNIVIVDGKTNRKYNILLFNMNVVSYCV